MPRVDRAGDCARVSTRRQRTAGTSRRSAVEQLRDASCDVARGRPFGALVLAGLFGTHGRIDRKQLHAHAGGTRFVVQYACEHPRRGHRDRTVAVARPRRLAASAADDHVMRVAARLGQQGNQVPRQRMLRDDGLSQAVAKFVCRQVQQSAPVALRRNGLAVRKCNDGARERPAERAQRSCQPCRIGIVVDVPEHRRHGAGGKFLLQFAEPVIARGNRHDRTSGRDQGADDGAADCPGGTNDDERPSDCPKNGMKCPVGGMIDRTSRLALRKRLIGLEVCA